VVWDGVARIDTALSAYFGAADGAYTRAVSRYLFTALAGRALSPGCQADMALILVDTQGTRKTSGVKALAPTPEAFGNADIGKCVEDDNVSARRVRGKLIIELGELKGLSGKTDEAVKDWVSKTHEVWRPLYAEHESRYARRCILIGTSNRDDLLTDPTGNRRWLPLRTGQVDDAAIERDRAQLWAEGVAVWRATGIAWQEAERLAKNEHEAFRKVHPWEEPIAKYLDAFAPTAPGEVPSPFLRGATPISTAEILSNVMHMPTAMQRQHDQNQVAAVMTRLGYVKRQIWDGPKRSWMWVSPKRGPDERTSL